MYIQQIIDDIDNDLSPTPFVQSGGSLLTMVGLPGTGKSSVVESLQKLIPCVAISTDNVRTYIRRNPTYTAAEMALVYEVCYLIIKRRLQTGQRVVFDASNYLQARREYLAKVAEECGAPVTVCSVQASQETIQQRLDRRVSGARSEHDMSDADWTVYKWMVENQEPVVGPHLIVDTTSMPPDKLAQNVYHYWLESESNAQNDPDLQPPRWASKLGFKD